MDNKEMLAILEQMAEKLETMRAMVESDIMREWHERHTTDLMAGSWKIIRVGTSIRNPDLIAFLGQRTVKISPTTAEWLPTYVIGLSRHGFTDQKNWVEKVYADDWATALIWFKQNVDD